MIAPVLFFFLRTVFAIQGPLCFHTNFKICQFQSHSISQRKLLAKSAINRVRKYSWPLDIMGLNCLGPLIHRIFFNSMYCSTTQSTDAASWIQGKCIPRANYEVINRFSIPWRVSQKSCVVQGSTVFFSQKGREKGINICLKLIKLTTSFHNIFAIQFNADTEIYI